MRGPPFTSRVLTTAHTSNTPFLQPTAPQTRPMRLSALAARPPLTHAPRHFNAVAQPAVAAGRRAAAARRLRAAGRPQSPAIAPASLDKCPSLAESYTLGREVNQTPPPRFVLGHAACAPSGGSKWEGPKCCWAPSRAAIIADGARTRLPPAALRHVVPASALEPPPHNTCRPSLSPTALLTSAALPLSQRRSAVAHSRWCWRPWTGAPASGWRSRSCPSSSTRACRPSRPRWWPPKPMRCARCPPPAPPTSWASAASARTKTTSTWSLRCGCWRSRRGCGCCLLLEPRGTPPACATAHLRPVTPPPRAAVPGRPGALPGWAALRAPVGARGGVDRAAGAGGAGGVPPRRPGLPRHQAAQPAAARRGCVGPPFLGAGRLWVRALHGRRAAQRARVGRHAALLGARVRARHGRHAQ